MTEEEEEQQMVRPGTLTPNSPFDGDHDDEPDELTDAPPDEKPSSHTAEEPEKSRPDNDQ